MSQSAGASMAGLGGGSIFAGLRKFSASRQSDVILAGFVLLSVSVILLPLPPLALDVMLSMNLIASLMLLLIAIYIPSPTFLSGFPSVLLLTTILRLALNIASTRLILLKGQAGALIHAVGDLVLGGDIIVGLVIFLILCLVQFLVVVKGAERVAEVSARFTLDAMPGKQMTIDADLRAGAYDQAEATRRRNLLATESQLYGAMDGAMKFVKGDTIAGLIITAINLLGGMGIGVMRNGMSLEEAAQVYSVLSVGDGIVAQIPSMLITLSSGMIITRVADDSQGDKATLADALRTQLFNYPKPLYIAGGFLFVMALIPGMPTFAFLFLGSMALGTAYIISQPISDPVMLQKLDPTQDAEAQHESMVAQAQRANVDEMLPMVTPILLELSPPLAEELNHPNTRFVSELLPDMRDALFYELGIRFVNVRIRANPHFRSPNAFLVHVNEVPQGLMYVAQDKLLVDEAPEMLANLGITGEPKANPLSGAQNTLVDRSMADLLAASGLRFYEYDQYVAMEVRACLERNAARFVGMHEVQTMLDQLEGTFPTMVKEVVPKIVTVARLTEILKRLVAEGISIRDFRLILESVAKWAPVHEDNADVAELVRADLRDMISYRHGGIKRSLAAYLLSASVEDAIRDAIGSVEGMPQLLLDPELMQNILAAARQQVQAHRGDRGVPVFLTDPEIRRYARQLLRIEFPNVVVLSYRELHPDMVIEPLAWISVD